MAWFAIYETVSGALLSVGTVVDDAALPPTVTKLALAGEPNFLTHRWNAVARVFEAIPPPTDDELLLAKPVPPVLNPTAAAGKPALLEFAKERIFDASQFDWFNTKAQSDGALSAPQKAAVAALNTTLYQRARAAIGAWYDAV